MKIVRYLIVVLFVFSGSVSATIITVNFDEVAVPNQTDLTGTTYFSGQGLSFEDDTTLAFHPVFTEDGVGVYNGSTTSKIIFDDLASNLFVSYAKISPVIDIIIDAYSLGDMLLVSFVGGGVNGIANIAAPEISYITFMTGGPIRAGIDSLTWTTSSIPEPTTLALFGLGLGGLGFTRRRMKRK